MDPNLVLTGDFNFCAFDPQDFEQLQNITGSFGLCQVVSELTHRDRCLDLVFLGQELSLSDCSISTPVEKYHCLVRCELDQLARYQHVGRQTVCWSWHLANWERAQFLLQYHQDGSLRDLSAELRACPSVSDAITYLNRCLRDIVSVCVPHRQRRLKRQPVPWFSREVAKAIRKRDAAFV